MTLQIDPLNLLTHIRPPKKGDSYSNDEVICRYLCSRIHYHKNKGTNLEIIRLGVTEYVHEMTNIDQRDELVKEIAACHDMIIPVE